MIAVLNIPSGQPPIDALPVELIGAWAIVLPDSATAQEIGLRVSVQMPDTATIAEIGTALKAEAKRTHGARA